MYGFLACESVLIFISWQGAVYGTSRFGSGYTYGGSGSSVAYRPFPFIFYPAPPAEHYYGGDEVC